TGQGFAAARPAKDHSRIRGVRYALVRPLGHRALAASITGRSARVPGEDSNAGGWEWARQPVRGNDLHLRPGMTSLPGVRIGVVGSQPRFGPGRGWQPWPVAPRAI